MGTYKERMILMEDLEALWSRLHMMLGSVLIEIEWSSKTELKHKMKSAISALSLTFYKITNIAERFYGAEHLSTNNGGNIGGFEERGSGESPLEKALDRELDTQEWIKQKTIQWNK